MKDYELCISFYNSFVKDEMVKKITEWRTSNEPGEETEADSFDPDIAAILDAETDEAALGIPTGSSMGQISRAYRQLSLRYHPDRTDRFGAPLAFRRIALARQRLQAYQAGAERDLQRIQRDRAEALRDAHVRHKRAKEEQSRASEAATARLTAQLQQLSNDDGAAWCKAVKTIGLQGKVLLRMLKEASTKAMAAARQATKKMAEMDSR